MHSLVMTVLGPDRPGVVELVAQAVREQGGNWLESRMAHLAGQFAGVVHVSVPQERVASLTAALQALSTQGLTVLVRSEQQDAGELPFVPLRLDLLGGDRPGIVLEVTRILTSRQVNVEEFQTECTAAPMSGERIFKATAQLRLPPGLTVAELQSELEQLGHDLMVDIRLHQ